MSEIEMDRAEITTHLNLFGVLPRMADLVRIDEQAQQLAQGMDLAVVFRVLGGPCVRVAIAHGEVTTSRHAWGYDDVGLLFRSCDELNRSFAGGKVTPVPYRGWWRLGEMQKFSQLADTLSRYLKPSEADMAAPAFRAKAVEMMLLTGLSCVDVVARHDPRVRALLGQPQPGTVFIDTLPDGPQAHVVIDESRVKAAAGPVDEPTATITFASIDTAADLLLGRLDVFAAIGTGDVRMSGLLTLADEVNWMLDRVGTYLS